MDHEQKRTLWTVSIALLVLAVTAMLVSLEIDKRRCSRLVLEQGYLESEFIPSSRMRAAQCIGRKRRNSNGTVNEQARADIPLPD